MMWIGLFDKKRDPFHPRDVGRCDCEHINFRLRYGKKDWLILTNESSLFFKVHERLNGQPYWFSFFREEFDVLPCYPLLSLTTVPDALWQPIPAGHALTLTPGALRTALPAPIAGRSGLFVGEPQSRADLLK